VDFIDQKNLTQVLEIVIPFSELIARRLASIESSERYYFMEVMQSTSQKFKKC
jgi:phage anti-repressor protein